MPNVAIVYYSSSGTNHAMAQAVAEGARAAGAEVRVRLVAETAPPEAIARNPGWPSTRRTRTTRARPPTTSSGPTRWSLGPRPATATSRAS